MTASCALVAWPDAPPVQRVNNEKRALLPLLEVLDRVRANFLETPLAALGALFLLLSVATMPSVLLARRGRPTAALAWILSLFAFPFAGVLAWWVFGRTRLERKRRKSKKRRLQYTAKKGSPSPSGATCFDRLFPERALADAVFTVREDDVTLLANGPRFFEALRRDLRAATHTIHILSYIFCIDETGESILQILEERARAGVKVRVIVDTIGSSGAVRALRKRITGFGGEFAVFIPSRLGPLKVANVNFVNHRKLIVIDGSLAFVGGMNIAREYEFNWHDLMVRGGRPVAHALEHIFLEDWYFATGEALDTPPRPPEASSGADVALVASGPDTEPWIFDGFFLLLTQAQKRIWIATPYFIPNSAILEALRTAAGRGVDVRIILPGKSDVRIVTWAARSYYRQLVDAKVRIFEFGGAMLHAKALLVDDDLLSVGSANIDSRSLSFAFEVNFFARSKDTSARLEEYFVELMRTSIEMNSTALAQKGVLTKLAESAAHLLSPVL